jgi:hypothetical protein
MKQFALILFLVSPVMLLAQRHTAIGLNFTVETTADEDGALPGLGAVADFKITKHSGIETGVYLRGYKTRLRILVPPSPNFWNVTIAERHLSFPLLYKYHTRIVNLAAGPTFDFFMGWKQKDNSGAVVNSYSIDPEFNVGIMGKISKRINLSPKFILEPEIRLNLIPTSERSYLGLGIAGKYIL